MDEIDQDRDLDLAFRREAGDGGDLGIIAVHDGDPGPGAVRVAAVRFRERVRDDGRDRLADRREQGLAFRLRALRHGRRSGAGRLAEQGGEDVIRGAGRGRDVGHGG